MDWTAVLRLAPKVPTGSDPFLAQSSRLPRGWHGIAGCVGLEKIDQYTDGGAGAPQHGLMCVIEALQFCLCGGNSLHGFSNPAAKAVVWCSGARPEDFIGSRRNAR